VSKEKVVTKTIRYLNLFKKNIKPLPPQHYEQLLFLIDICKQDEEPITNTYLINKSYKDSSNLPMFKLRISMFNSGFGFGYQSSRIDLKLFLNFNNWHHIAFLSFCYCEWFDNDDWRNLVDYADNFRNMKQLSLSKCV
jgi:hypothetical protein